MQSGKSGDDKFLSPSIKLYWARFIVGVLERSSTPVDCCYQSSLPLSCALEHFLGAGMDANESFWLDECATYRRLLHLLDAIDRAVEYINRELWISVRAR